MKEFEEQYGKDSPTNYDEYIHQEGAKEGWRAALEWAVGEHGPLDERINNCDCARGRIRKELEN